MSPSDGDVPSGGPVDEFEVALRSQIASNPSGADLGAPLAHALDGGRLPIVFPAHVVADAIGRGADDPSQERGRAWLVGELGRSFGGRSTTAWRAAIDTDRIAVVVLDEPGFDPPPLPGLGAAITRVSLPPGHTARHLRSPWPGWIRVVTFALLAVGVVALAWSYDIRAWQAIVLGVAIGATFARLGPHPPLRLWRFADIGSWTSFRRVARQGTVLFALVGLIVGALAIDGLSARDAALVVLPLVVGGAWIGGGDCLAAMAHHGRGRVVADLGSTRVLERTGPFGG